MGAIKVGDYAISPLTGKVVQFVAALPTGQWACDDGRHYEPGSLLAVPPERRQEVQDARQHNAGRDALLREFLAWEKQRT
jgi:hypothetical protein